MLLKNINHAKTLHLTNMKRTKIVATIGPSCYDKNILKEMILNGVNVCRLNFSHGEHATHEKVIQTIREINEELGYNTAILADLQGPKIRIRDVENNGVELVNGAEIVFTTEDCLGTSEKVSITYEQLPQDVQPGERILVDDGKIALEVVSSDGKKEVKMKVVFGGILSSKKGVNLPNTKISLPCLTEKDLKDLDFALSKHVDWIGLSFVRSAQDIRDLKAIIDTQKSSARVIAKIEKPEAVKAIDEIMQVTDGIMVARGDLGVEVPLQNVPLIQKMLVKKCLKFAKPIIIATQMMESMITNFAPTRAEVNDVANAVLDRADAVMLSGETSVGKFPVKVIETMSQIVSEIETFEGIYHHEKVPEKNQNRFISDSICFNACRLAQRVEAKGIVTMTFSGYTAYKVSSQRPKANIFVFTSNRKILTQLNLLWGVQGFYYDKMVSTDDTVSDIKLILKKQNLLVKDDLVINIASMPIEARGNTNMLKLSYVD